MGSVPWSCKSGERILARGLWRGLRCSEPHEERNAMLCGSREVDCPALMLLKSGIYCSEAHEPRIVLL